MLFHIYFLRFYAPIQKLPNPSENILQGMIVGILCSTSIIIRPKKGQIVNASLPDDSIKGGAAGTAVQGSVLTLPKHTLLSTPSLQEMEERAPYRARTICSRQDSQQVPIKCCTWYSSKHIGFFLLTDKSRRGLRL